MKGRWRMLGRLLFAGQRHDWRYSLVVVLVITGMFSTPLVLGSVRNRVYSTVRDQVEKENNAREISIQAGPQGEIPLDRQLVDDLSLDPELRVLGNHKRIVVVTGPAGSHFGPLETLSPDDPRQTSLRVTPELPRGLGERELLLPNRVGEALYGDSWDELWRDGAFHGEPLRLEAGDRELPGEWRVVARAGFPGRDFYAAPSVGAGLRRYSEGLGAPELGLPPDPDLVHFALPRLAPQACWLVLNPNDATCEPDARANLLRRLEQRRLQPTVVPSDSRPVEARGEVANSSPNQSNTTARHWVNRAVWHLEATVEHSPDRGVAVGDCRELIRVHLAERCTDAVVVPDLRVPVRLYPRDAETEPTPSATTSSNTPPPILLAAAPSELRRWLRGAEALANLHGLAPPPSDGAVPLAVAEGAGFAVGQTLTIKALGHGLKATESPEDRPGAEPTGIPAIVERLYSCPDGASCPAFTEAAAAHRVRNVAAGTARVVSRSPLLFAPPPGDVEFDEILVYAPRVEAVESVVAALRADLPGHQVLYHSAAIDRLKRQDARLTSLFQVTIGSSALFIVLAVGALALINIQRRRRQMAQLLILGYRRAFVRRLVVSEYLLLTFLAAAAAWALTALLCAAARRLLLTRGDGASDELSLILNALDVDPMAFLGVFGVVATCTWLIALVAARTASQSDPLTLLD